MLYYRVKPEFDNVRRDKDFNIFIGNELYTPKELEKVRATYNNRRFNFDSIFEKVEISRKKIYFFFGARFAN